MSRRSSFYILLTIVLVSVGLVCLVCFAGQVADPVLTSLLPGKFGPGIGWDMTGNHLFAALILLLNALVFLLSGFGALLHASRTALLIGPDRMERLLHGRAGLSREDIAATNFAVAEEQKDEIRFLHTGRHLVWIGAVILIVAFAAVCFTYAHADAHGTALLTASGATIANDAVSAKDVVLFTADQLTGAVLLDLPSVYKWHVTAIGPNDAQNGLTAFILLLHILIKLTVLATLFALWRGANLRACILRMAEPEENYVPSFTEQQAVVIPEGHHTDASNHETMAPQDVPALASDGEHANEHDHAQTAAVQNEEANAEDHGHAEENPEPVAEHDQDQGNHAHEHDGREDHEQGELIRS